MISILFKEGRNLAPKDSNNLSDPYIKALLPLNFPVVKTETVKSHVNKETLNPKWYFYTTCFVGVTPQDFANLPPVTVSQFYKLNDNNLFYR